MDKSKIIKKIKEHYDFKSDAEFARYLGIKPQTLSSWYARNTFDIDLLYAKCIGIDANWLLTGTGPMFRNSSSVDSSFELLELEKELGELKDKYIRNLEELISIRKECFSEKKANRDVSREADK